MTPRFKHCWKSIIMPDTLGDIGGLIFYFSETFLDEAHRWVRHKRSKLYDILEDTANDISRLLTHTTENILYQTSLSRDSHIPRTFRHFKYLPYEIRAQIWEQAFPSGRVITLRNHIPKRWPWSTPQNNGTTSHSRIPAVLHACQETRYLALKSYSLAFGSSEHFETPVFCPKVYVDFSRDTLYIPQDLLCKMVDREYFRETFPLVYDLERIRALATGSITTLGNFAVLSGLEELIICARPRFTLGIGPQMRRDECTGKSGIERDYFLSRSVCARCKESNPDWERPRTYKGWFVKGDGDRWYCEGEGRRFDGST